MRSRPSRAASRPCAHDVEAGAVAWDPTLEDVHLNLETLLTARVGAVGGKLHTGRSRNDQVATDLRLWSRRAIDRLDVAIVGLERALVGLAEREGDAVLPGSTHIQPAQPVLFAHHLLAYVEMLERDRGRLADARAPAQRLAARRGALAGAGYPARPRDDGRGARLRRRHAPTRSTRSSDRDFVVELIAAAALAMVHLSRLAEEITWWSNPRFGFVRVADAFSTGLVDDAQQEEPGSGRARPRPDGGRDRRPDDDAGRCSRACRSRTSATSRRTSRRCSRGRPRSRPRCGVMAGLVETLAVDRARMRGLRKRATRRRRRSPTSSSGAACRSGPRTTSWAALSVGRRRSASRRSRRCPYEAYRAALDGSDDPVARSLAKEKGDRRGAARGGDHRGRAGGRRRDRRHRARARGAGPAPRRVLDSKADNRRCLCTTPSVVSPMSCVPGIGDDPRSA